MRGSVILLALVMASCAGYSVTEGGTGDGYDVYRPDPYLLREPLTHSQTGQLTGFKFSVKWLPNYSKRYRVRSWTGLGKSDISFTFTDGWKLTAVHDKSDNTEVLKSMVELAKHAIPANPFDISGGTKGGKQSGGTAEGWDLIEASNEPVLYKIVFDDCGDICGLKRFRIQDCGGNQSRAFVDPIWRGKGLRPGDARNGGGGGMQSNEPDPADG